MTLTPPRKILLTALLALAAFMLAASTASARVLWTANAERPEIREWANHSCESDDRVNQVSNPAAQGSKAYRIEVRDGDDSYGERCELGQANPHREGFPLFNEGDDRWIGYQVYLPENLNTNSYTNGRADWTVIMQLKQLGSLGTPAVSMDFERNRFILMNSDTNHESSGCNWWWEHPVVKGRWLKFLYRVKFSPNKDVGFVELYGDLDGTGVKQLMPRTYMHTMKRDNAGKTVQSHSRVGLYRDPDISGTAHAFFDGYTVGTDRTSVEGAAFGPGSSVVPPVPTASPSRGDSGDRSGSRPKPRARRPKKRVWLRMKQDGMMAAAARAAGPQWGRMLPVYGGIRSGKRRKGRTVMIQIRRGGRWQWLTRGWLRSDGRFYLAPTVDAPGGKTVKLRARVKGVGRSNVIRARI